MAGVLSASKTAAPPATIAVVTAETPTGSSQATNFANVLTYFATYIINSKYKFHKYSCIGPTGTEDKIKNLFQITASKFRLNDKT